MFFYHAWGWDPDEWVAFSEQEARKALEPYVDSTDEAIRFLIKNPDDEILDGFHGGRKSL